VSVSNSSRVAVFCDTTAYLPQKMLDRWGVRVVSLYVRFGEDQEAEGEITDYGAFYERLRLAEDLPSTSQPSVGDFVEAFRSELDAGRDVIAVTISSGISGTYQSALQARQQLVDEGVAADRLEVHDSSSSCGGLGMMAIAAAAAAASGEELPGVLNRVKATHESLKMWFAVDTLEYLRRGGRIGAASAWVGSTLQIKPILTLENEITPVERVRTRRKVFDRLLDYARQRHELGADAWVVQHIQATDTANRLVERCQEIFGCDPIFVSEIGPVIGAHIGPGLLGVGSVHEDLLK
jgi:DegV family protein with EDD domain